jgi:hypothetical protein
MDHKQKKLILAWHEQSVNSSNEYLKFMSNWIAFNAICYSLYHEKAIREKAQIDTGKSKIEKVVQLLVNEDEGYSAEAKIVGREDRLTIDIKLPERLFLTIKKTFTEDNIYREFIRDYEAKFNIDEDFIELVEKFQESIFRDNNYYVINMLKINKFNQKDITKMIEDEVVVQLNEIKYSNTQRVLYQIRNNIFHGEKVPGDVNDDRIVKGANPVLNYIVSACIKNLKINV